jgi:acyl-CoA thioesterase-1
MGRIIFFGDSLTAGYGLSNPSTESLPALIQHNLRESKSAHEVVNAGVSGDTSSGGLSRLEYWMNSPIDVFILELGINDAIRGLPASATFRNLDTILKKVKHKYPACKLMIMGIEIPGIMPSAKLDEFKGIFRKLAEEHQAVLVPFFLQGVAGIKHLNLRDGIHPSNKGYRVIADNIWPIIKSTLEIPVYSN